MNALSGKSGQDTYIAPLQPSTLAAFRPWGSSIGAGRISLARDKSNLKSCKKMGLRKK